MAVKSSILRTPTSPNNNRSKATFTPFGSPRVFTSLPAEAWGVHKIGVPDLRCSKEIYGEGVVVAIIDSGVDVTHGCLADNFNGDWADPVDVSNKKPIDINGHGTAAASILIGRGIGIAPEAKWVACRAFNANGDGNEDWVTSCAQWVADLPSTPNIVSNSWGADHGGDEYFNRHIQTWDALNIHHVFSIGDSGPDCGTVRSPGDQTVAFGVGNVDNNDNHYTTSSVGPNPRQFTFKPDLSAPGTNILVAAITARNEYITMTGTDYATSHVAGAMALILSAFRGNPPNTQELREFIIKHSRRPAYTSPTGLCCFSSGSTYPNSRLGHGILDMSTMPFPQFNPTDF